MNNIKIIIIAGLVANCSAANFEGQNGGNGKKGNDTMKSDNQTPEGTKPKDSSTNTNPNNDLIIPKGDNILNPVDTFCTDNNKGSSGIQIAPLTPNLPKTVPDSCRSGIEFNSFKQGSFELSANAALTTNSNLEIDVATYTAADAITLTAVTPSGEQVFLKTCRLRTWNKGDPTSGTGSNTRPLEETIRSFRTMIPSGTTSIKFDFTGASSPTYLKVLGLCQFNLSPVNAKANMPVPPLRPVN